MGGKPSADGKPAATPPPANNQKMDEALQRIMSHSLANKPGTPDYELKKVSDQLAALQQAFLPLEKDIASNALGESDKREKELLLHEEALMKMLIGLDAIHQEAYREQRRAAVKNVQEWQRRVDASKKLLADRKASM